jgi:L-aminopeptidase/D-esterase-like protein
MMVPGARNLITDVEGLMVGNSEDTKLKSGSTVLVGAAPFTASYAVMGGAPGTRDTDLLEPDKSVQAVDALVLLGGSAFGLDAASGVVAGLSAQGRGFLLGALHVPLVPAAILADLLNGGNKNWQVNPYPSLGARAFEAAANNFNLGNVGAGTGALTGTLKGGLGSTSLVLDSGATVGALVAVNPIGNVTTPSGRHFWAAPFELNQEFGGLGPDPSKGLGYAITAKKLGAMSVLGNTTIAIVATDVALDKAAAKRLAVAAHDGIGRATLPAHMPMDGDLVFAAATA